MPWSKNGLVVKSKKLNLALQGSLTLREVRVIQLAIMNVRTNIEAHQPSSPIYIHANQYSHYFGLEEGCAGYLALIHVSETLGSRVFSFADESDSEHLWFESVEYLEGTGILKLVLSQAMYKEVSFNLEDMPHNSVTSYRLESSTALNSVYAVRLYELMNQWRLLKTTPLISMTTLRKQFGLPDDRYRRMSDFKRLVLDQSIAKINALTTMHITYTQKKSGKNITHIQFQFHRTNRRGQPPTPSQLKANYLASKEQVNKPPIKSHHNDY